MEIKTKFDKDQTVFTMVNNKPKEIKIAGVSTFTGVKRSGHGNSISSPDGKSIIKYFTNEEGGEYNEEDLFETKEDLKASLFGEPKLP